MAKQGQSILLLMTLLSLAILLCIFSIHNSPISCTQIVKAATGGPPRIAFSAGSCNCSVDYFPVDIYKPSVDCNCSSITTPPLVCPPAEVRIIEKVQPVVKENMVREVAVEEPCPEKQHDPPPVIQSVVVRHDHELPWWAEGKAWHYPVKFPRCSMDACFDYSRCDNMDDLLIFSYHVPSPPVRYFSRINETKWHTSDPHKACLFFVYLDADGPWPPHPSQLPHWNNGLNHVLVIFADKWSQRGPHQDSIAKAAVLASDMHETIYRPGFDISITLPGNLHLTQLQQVKPFDRKYLLTFRGLRYLGHEGEGVLRSHESFRAMHNVKLGIVVATSCKHFINDLIRKNDPALGVHCDEDEAVYANYTYHDLMNSTFGLVPAGISSNSYRFVEVLSAGTIPVLIADNYVKPFDTLFQWHRCVLQFPSTEMHRVASAVKSMKREEVEKRQQICVEFYRSFRSDEILLETVIRSLKARFMGVFPNFSEI